MGPPDEIDRPRTDRRDYSRTAADYDLEDYDLSIGESNDEKVISGDMPGTSTEQPWDRIETQNGSPAGLQDIQNEQIEWPTRDSLVLSLGNLLHPMRELVR